MRTPSRTSRPMESAHFIASPRWPGAFPPGYVGRRECLTAVASNLCCLLALELLRIPSVSIDDLWYKNAVIYCLDVEKYQDANGDGVGDFEGLMRRLDYLAGLGVTCVWLQPFYRSPNRDNGYD